MVTGKRIWEKPWSLTEGFLIGAGLIIAGLALELSVGPVVWEVFAWPANALVLAAFLLAVGLLFLLRNKVYAFSFLCTVKAALPALVYAVVLTIIMGLTRQTVNGTWLYNMLTFWPFVLIYAYITLILGLVSLKQICGFIRRPSLSSLRLSLFSHLGLFIALLCATIGNADMQRMKMITVKGETEWRVLNEQGEVVEMPIAIELEQFLMETYDDGSPKRFASDLHIYTMSGESFRTVVDVNKPAEVAGWKIYQYGYDTAMGAASNVSILELVRDPWQPAVYAGIYLMIFGAILQFLFGGKPAPCKTLKE